jgi:hypothetical protein
MLSIREAVMIVVVWLPYYFLYFTCLYTQTFCSVLQTIIGLFCFLSYFFPYLSSRSSSYFYLLWRTLSSERRVMATNIAAQRIKREFKEVIKSEEVSLCLSVFHWRITYVFKQSFEKILLNLSYFYINFSI